jgi:hypothetical protein
MSLVSFFCDFTELVPTFRDNLPVTSLRVNPISLVCLTFEGGKGKLRRKSINNNIRCVTFQKRKDIIDIATDASNHAVFIFDDILYRHAGVLVEWEVEVCSELSEMIRYIRT